MQILGYSRFLQPSLEFLIRIALGQYLILGVWENIAVRFAILASAL